MIDKAKKKASRLINDRYLFLIEEWRKEKNNLTEEKLRNLVKANKFHTQYGIDEIDVLNDINMLDIDVLKKNNYKLSALQNYPFKKDLSDDERKSKSHQNNDNNDNIVNVIDINDKKLANQIYSLISKHPNLLSDPNLLKNALADVIIENKMKLNLLRILVDCGILEEINRNDKYDNVIRYKFVNKLVDDYGVKKELAERMVLIWFDAGSKAFMN